MLSGQWVMRNNTNRDDAVYVVTATLNDGVYTITGSWGKWDTFLTGGKLGNKVYYSGVFEYAAQRAFNDLIFKKMDRNYERVRMYDTALPWEQATPMQKAVAELKQKPKPAPVPTPRTAPHPIVNPMLTRKDIQVTRAGILELD